MNEEVKHYKNKSVWLRGLYMLIFLFLQSVAKFVAFAVIVLQFVNVLFTAQTNQHLLKLGKSLSIYHYQIFMYLTYNSEQQPFPLGSWPVELKTAIKSEEY